MNKSQRKGYGKGSGIIVLFLIAFMVLLGCPTGGSTDPEPTPGGDDGGKTSNGGGGGGPGSAGSTDTGTTINPDGAEDLVENELKGYATADKTTATVTLNSHVKVVADPTNYSLAGARAAGDSADQAAYVKTFTIPSGVTFIVAEEKTITVESGGKITVDRKTTTYNAAAFQVPTSAKVVVKGTIDSSGPITVARGGELEVQADATLTVNAAASIEVQAGGEVKAAGTITVAKEAKITSAGTITVAATGKVVNSGTITGSGNTAKLTVEDGGKVTVQDKGTADLSAFTEVKVAASGGIEVKTESKVVLPDTAASNDALGKITGGGDVAKGSQTITITKESETVSYGASNALSVAFVFNKAVRTCLISL